MEQVTEDLFTVADAPKLEVENENGRVDVEVGADDTVHVRSTLSDPSTIDYRVQQDGDVVRVVAKGVSKGGLLSFMRRSGEVAISVAVPRRTDVAAGTVNGDVVLQGVEGSGRLSTVNGKLVMSDVKGDFEGSTVNGGISFSGEMAPGSKNEFSTVNGGVKVRLQGGTRVKMDASTVNGSVSVTPPEEPPTANGEEEARLDVATVNGSVTVA